MTAVTVHAQRGRGAGAGDAPTPRQSAPVDLTGYWVSIVIEDWRYRMTAAEKGDTGGVPVNADGRRVAGEWNPSRDAAAGEACRAYGAPGLMRLPGRLHITWQDDYTLKIDTDAGTQTRLLRFANPQGRGAAAAPAGGPPERTWQGQSAAAWDSVQGAGASRWGTLRVLTTQLRPGYLRRNGVPYSENTTLTEYFDLHPGPRNTTWITITTVVNDPRYLTQEFVTSTDFRKETDGSKWAPTQCAAE
ncbi:MAG: hypothetical protein HOP16_08625 [Acidobacteria bacterium]|nr:hypothetical protein [Acidobacteriota bacterium]